MGWLHRLRTALADTFRRRRFEREIDEELREFLALDAQERERAGASAAEARRAARASFGSIEACKEYLRDIRAGAAIDSVAQDVRVAARVLRRSPGFTAAAILTIGLGTFPLAATAGLVNWLFFRPAPGVTGADRLVRIEVVTRDASGDSDRARLSAEHRASLIQRVGALAGLAGRSGGATSIAAPGVDARHVDIEVVSHDYFQVLGMRMAAGRAFVAGDEPTSPGADAVILGHALAGALFGAAEHAPGRPVLVNGRDSVVAGVAPPGFRGLKNDHFPEAWLPGASWAELIGRLAASADVERAERELSAAIRGLAEVNPVENGHFQTAVVHVERQPGMSFSSPNTRTEVTSIVTMCAAAGSVLLVLAGANLGNLLLFHGARRRGETAMRSALGASRLRLLRAHLAEVCLLAVAGGAVGLGLTWVLGRLLGGVIVPEAGYLVLPIDWRTGGLVLAGAVVVGLVFGGAPALIASSRASLPLAAQRSGTRRGSRLRGTLTVLQLALSLSLLVGATLLLATMRNLAAVDLGFEPAPIAAAVVLPHDNGYDDTRALRLYRELLARAAASPAVTAVSVSGGAPLVRRDLQRVHLPGQDAGRAIAVSSNNVSADYFRVLGLPLLVGRMFTEEEAFAPSDGTCGPVIISESLARRLFGTREALGRFLEMPRGRQSIACGVIGVAADVRSGPDGEWEATLYRPLGRSILFRATILVRSDAALPAALAALRDAMRSIDPAVPLRLARPLADGVAFQMAGRRLLSSVLGVLAVLGLTMAAVGLYGLVGESVVDRTREIAVRIAIGARAPRIIRDVLRHALVLTAIGIATGVVLAAGLAGAIRSQLYGVTAVQPWVYLSVAGALAGVVLVASLAPAIRAVRINPVDVLRGE